MQQFRLLTEEHVKSLLPMPALVAAMEAAVARFSAGDVLQPVRTVMMVGATRGYYGVMPAFVAQPPTLGTKIVTVFNENHRRALPSHLATILLMDPETGALQAILDGRFITEARTAAVSAVSARYLARPDAARLAIIGSGVQARSHLEALAEVRPLSQVRIWSPREVSRRRFVDEMQRHVPARLESADTAEAAVADAGIVVLVTSSPTPVIEDEWIAPGTHVISVGACRPDHREMAPALVSRARVYVDSRAGALVESGDVVQGMKEGRFGADHLVGELGELVLGRVKGRETANEVTLFKSLGMAVEDVVAADLVLQRAIETGAGTTLML